MCRCDPIVYLTCGDIPIKEKKKVFFFVVVAAYYYMPKWFQLCPFANFF